MDDFPHLLNRYRYFIFRRADGSTFVVDNDAVRLGNFRKRLFAFAGAVRDAGLPCVMVTLTYSPTVEWDKRHISELFNRLRHRALWSRVWGYAWVVEIQARGVPHYHILLVYQNGTTIPHFDTSGLWPHGMTRNDFAVRSPFYLCSYVGKRYQKNFSLYPKGCRLFAIVCRDADTRLSLRYASLSSFERSLVDAFGWDELKFISEWRSFVELVGGAVEYLGGSTSAEIAKQKAAELSSVG